TEGPPAASVRPVVSVPSTHRCFGNPPRQIEDPQSPPCVPAWRGDNGGATTKGVTENEVRVVVPVASEPNVPADYVNALERFFNNRFEFYGRQLRLIREDTAFDQGTAEQTAWAVRAD